MNQNDILAHQFKGQNFVVSAGVYLYSGGKILIGHPTGSPMNIWSIPKGQVDNLDTLRDTAIRELLEETTIDISKYTIKKEAYLGYNRYKKVKKYLFSFFIEIEEDITDMELSCPSMAVHYRTKLPIPEIDKFRWVEPVFLLDYLNFKQYNDANKNLATHLVEVF